jgi:hypothetical protein
LRVRGRLLRFWASEEEKARWEREAREEGHSLSSWLRIAAEDRIKSNRVLKQLLAEAEKKVAP